MSITRKIGFYSLALELNSDRTQVLPVAQLKDVLDYVMSLEKQSRQNLLGADSYCFLSDLETVQARDDIKESDSQKPDIQKLIFKRASYGSRPPLVDKDTLEERDNPKELTEGERSLTHTALRYLDNEVIVLLETVTPGVTINRVERYLDEYASKFHQTKGTQKNYTICYRIIAKENFLEELSKLSRVTVGNIYLEKQILGSEYLNLSNRTRDVKEQIQVSVSAQRKKSIGDFIEDAYSTSQSSEIHLILVEFALRNKNGSLFYRVSSKNNQSL